MTLIMKEFYFPVGISSVTRSAKFRLIDTFIVTLTELTGQISGV